MSWTLKVYDVANVTELGTLSSAHGIEMNARLGTLGALRFTVDEESTADLALLTDRRKVRVYDGASLLETFLVDASRIAFADRGELPGTTFSCPGLAAELGTSDSGGAVVYPFQGLAGRLQDPRRFGPEAFEFDDSAWPEPTSDGPPTSAEWPDDQAERFIFSKRAVIRRVLPAGTYPSTSGRMFMVGWSSTRATVYLDGDRVLNKESGQRGIFTVDIEYDGEEHVVLIDVEAPGGGRVAWSWGETNADEELTGTLFSTYTEDVFGGLGAGGTKWAILDDYATYPGMPAGYIMKRLMDEAQTRGALSALDYDFDDDVDSDGLAWSTAVAWSFPVGSKLGWVAEQLTQFGYDWRVTPTGTLQIFELLGSDLTATVDLDVIEEGRKDREGIRATALLIQTAAGMSDADVASAVGRIEEAATFGTVDNPAQLDEVVTQFLDELSSPRDPVSLALAGTSDQPYDAFALGDVVSFTGPSGTATGRVTEVVGVLDDADGLPSWTVTVDREDGQFSRERARRVRDQLRETFAETVGGRSLLSSPRRGFGGHVGAGGSGGQSTISEGSGNAPSTITLAAEGPWPSGWSTAEFDTVVGGTSRRNLFPLDVSEGVESVPLPYGGTWEERIILRWELSGSFYGGGQVRASVGDDVVWPAADESTEVEGTAALLRPEFQGGFTVVAGQGDALAIEVNNPSSETQDGRLLLEVSLREPQGVGLFVGDPVFPSLLLVGNALLDQDGWSKISSVSGTSLASAFPSDDGFRIASAPISSSDAATYSVRDAATDTAESGWPSLGDYSGEVCRCSPSVSPDGSKIAIAVTYGSGNTHDLHVLDVATKTVESGWPSGVTSTMNSERAGVSWSPDGTRLVWAVNELRVYDYATKTQESGWPSGTGRIQCAAFSPDGGRLAIWGGGEAVFQVIDVATKTAEAGWPSKSKGSIFGFYSALAWASDGAYLVVVDDRNTGSTANIIIDVETKTVTSSFELDPPSSNHNAHGAAWSRDGQYMAMVWGIQTSDSVTLQVFDVATTAQVFRGSLADVGSLVAVLFPGNHSAIYSP